jgi:broad-specificity NMP kinase
MNKIIVIGCSGSGKTTSSEKLRDKTGLPLFYLDAIWHKPDRTHISREEYDARLAEILALTFPFSARSAARSAQTAITKKLPMAITPPKIPPKRTLRS